MGDRTPSEPRMTSFIEDFFEREGLRAGDFRIGPLAGDGSKRRFSRIQIPGAELSYVIMQYEPADPYAERENRAYLEIGRHLQARGIPVPRIHKVDLVSGLFIMEDLGDLNLQAVVMGRDPLPQYEEVLRILLHMQIEGAKGFDPAWTCQSERYDRSVMQRYEADYFKNAFLQGYLGLKSEWPELKDSLDLIAQRASIAPSHFFLHRDFQSRNIMVCSGKIGIIDWQGGRFGPLGYDLASLVIDPYTDLSTQDRTAVYQSYLSLLKDLAHTSAESFEDSFPYLALQRNLQILGAFSYLSKTAGKPQFAAYIPKAVDSLLRLLGEIPEKGVAPLKDLVESISKRFQGTEESRITNNQKGIDPLARRID